MTTTDATGPDVAVDSEAAARAALAELIAKHDLPEPAKVRWHETRYGTYFYGQMSLTAATRDDVTAWAEALKRKVITRQVIRVCDYAPDEWYCAWDTEVALKNWRPGVQLTVNHNESRFAKTAAAVRAEEHALIERVLDSALGGKR